MTSKQHIMNGADKRRSVLARAFRSHLGAGRRGAQCWPKAASETLKLQKKAFPEMSPPYAATKIPPKFPPKFLPKFPPPQISPAFACQPAHVCMPACSCLPSPCLPAFCMPACSCVHACLLLPACSCLPACLLLPAFCLLLVSLQWPLTSALLTSIKSCDF